MKKLLLTALLILFICPLTANAALKVSPMILELDANGAKGNYLTTSFDVKGGDDEVIRFKIYPEFFEIDDEGKMSPISKSDAANSLVSHARIVPNEFTIQKGQTQKVRLTFSNLNKLPDGESRMVVFLEDVAAKEVMIPNENKNISTKLIVRTRVGVPIYVDKGNYTKAGSLDDLTVEKFDEDLVYRMKLSSSGNSKVRYGGQGQIIKNKALVEEFPITSNVIGANGKLLTEGKIPVEKLTQGEYTLRTILNYKDAKGKNKNMIKEVNFSVKGAEST